MTKTNVVTMPQETEQQNIPENPVQNLLDGRTEAPNEMIQYLVEQARESITMLNRVKQERQRLREMLAEADQAAIAKHAECVKYTQDIENWLSRNAEETAQ